MDADDYEGIHGFGNRNKEGELLLEIGQGLDLAIVNTYLKKP